jgi:hypothetical protein
MEPIRVPRPPKEAFNQHRPVSDLIAKQVEHFRHVEAKLSDAQRASLPQGHIRTEHEAAQYIRAVTQLLLSKPTPAAQPQVAPVVMPVRAAEPGRGIAIAAAEEKQASAGARKKAAHRPRKTKKGKKG